MKAMAEAHARRERRSERKVQILVEIKSALEQQIHLLEEGEGDSDEEYDLVCFRFSLLGYKFNQNMGG